MDNGYTATVVNGYTTSSQGNKNNGIIWATLFNPPISGSLTEAAYFGGSTAGTVTNIGRLRFFGVDSNGLPDMANELTTSTTFTPEGGFVHHSITVGTPFNVTANTPFYITYTNASSAASSNYWSHGYDLSVAGVNGLMIASSNNGANWDHGTTQNAYEICKIDGKWCSPWVSRGINSGNSSVSFYSSGSYVARDGIIFRVLEPTVLKYALTAFTCQTTPIPAGYIVVEIYNGATLLQTSGRSGSTGSTTTNANAATTYTSPFGVGGPVLQPGTEYRAVARYSSATGNASSYLKHKTWGTHNTYKPDSTSVMGTILGGCYSTSETITTTGDWTDSRDIDSPTIPTIGLVGIPQQATSSSATSVVISPFSIFQSVVT